MKYWKYLFLLLFVCQSAFSQTTDQNYPVTAQAFVVGQPQDKLSAYFSSSTALTVNLLLKDLTRSTLQVYLQWSLEGPGVRIASAPGYIPPAFITLDRGLIHRLSGLDLQGTYFRPQAMEAEGLAAASPTQLRLPEGFYTFRVQALEAGTRKGGFQPRGDLFLRHHAPAAGHQPAFQRCPAARFHTPAGFHSVDAPPLPPARPRHHL